MITHFLTVCRSHWPRDISYLQSDPLLGVHLQKRLSYPDSMEFNNNLILLDLLGRHIPVDKFYQFQEETRCLYTI